MSHGWEEEEDEEEREKKIEKRLNIFGFRKLPRFITFLHIFPSSLSLTQSLMCTHHRMKK